MKWLAVAAAVVLLLPALFIGAAFAELGPTSSGSASGVVQPEGSSDIPPEILALYTEAAGQLGIPVSVLAAVGKMECNHNRNPACADPNSAGAVGPMQFMPGTFVRYASASGSLSPSILDPRDSIFAAAAKLAADGVARDPWAAIFSYNHSDAYVAKLIGWAVAYGWRPDGQILARTVLGHPNLSLRPQARSDVGSGLVDGRLLAVLVILANSHRFTFVGPFFSGHSTYVAGTDRVSNHTGGRAVDLPMVDGSAVSSANDSAREVVRELLELPPGLVPDEVGTPGPVGIDERLFYESDHLHLGFS